MTLETCRPVNFNDFTYKEKCQVARSLNIDLRHLPAANSQGSLSYYTTVSGHPVHFPYNDLVEWVHNNLFVLTVTNRVRKVLAAIPILHKNR